MKEKTHLTPTEVWVVREIQKHPEKVQNKTMNDMAVALCKDTPHSISNTVLNMCHLRLAGVLYRTETGYRRYTMTINYLHPALPSVVLSDMTEEEAEQYERIQKNVRENGYRIDAFGSVVTQEGTKSHDGDPLDGPVDSEYTGDVAVPEEGHTEPVITVRTLMAQTMADIEKLLNMLEGNDSVRRYLDSAHDSLVYAAAMKYLEEEADTTYVD